MRIAALLSVFVLVLLVTGSAMAGSDTLGQPLVQAEMARMVAHAPL